MDIANILFLVICCIFPYGGIMITIAIFATKAKWKSAHQILRNIETRHHRDEHQVSTAFPAYAIISMIFISFLVLGLLCITPIIFAYYLNYPVDLPKIDFRVLRILLISLLIFGIVGTIILWIFWAKISRSVEDK